MSSPLHTARCVACTGRVVEIELGPTSAIGVHFPISRFLALALLHEAASGTVFERAGRPWRRARQTPLANELAFDEVSDFSSIDTPDAAKDAVAQRYIADASYVATRNFTPAVWTRDATGVFRDPAISPRDPRMVRALATLQALHDADPDDAGRHPHATLRIEVTDLAWVAHLEPTMIWDVYAFDEAAAILA